MLYRLEAAEVFEQAAGGCLAFSFTQAGLNGAMFVMLAHGISTGGLFMLAGIMHERRHTYEISEFGGLASPMPVYAASYLVIVLASAGLPLLERIHWGISGDERRVSGQSQFLEFSRPPASYGAQFTCCGCTSVSSSTESYARGEQFLGRSFGIRKVGGVAVRGGCSGDGSGTDLVAGSN